MNLSTKLTDAESRLGAAQSGWSGEGRAVPGQHVQTSTCGMDKRGPTVQLGGSIQHQESEVHIAEAPLPYIRNQCSAVNQRHFSKIDV